jgi:transcriptional regulator with XRE-family HTH domain
MFYEAKQRNETMQLTKLRAWRHVRGETQETLARRSGVSMGRISEIERRQGCTPTTARKLASALDIAIADLIDPPPQRAYATA